MQKLILTKATPLLLIKPSKYDYLNPCSKFCLNSCRDTNGTVNEPKCNPSEKSEGWGQYKGLADQLRCRTAECLCASGAFNITFGKLYQSGVKYCNLLPSTADLPSPEYTRLQGVLADYCTDNNFRPDGWYLEVEGQPPGAKPGAKGEAIIRDIDSLRSALTRTFLSRFEHRLKNCSWNRARYRHLHPGVAGS